MKLLIICVTILISVQLNNSWERPHLKNVSILNYFVNRTARFYNFVKEKAVTTKNYILDGKNKIVNFTEDKITSLKTKLKYHINEARGTVGNVYESIISSPEKHNCSDEYIGNHLTTPQLIAMAGYEAESHTITTDDGYILTVHRMPTGKKTEEKAYQRTVLLHHGILATSADWIIPGPGKGLAYILSDAGYDVWMANARGNTYSRANVNKTIDSYAFWNFTFHEVGYYDLAAVLDYIVDKKGKGDITYIGFSMGTTVLFALLSSRPEYDFVLKEAYAIAPIAFMSDVKGPFQVIADYGDDIENFMKLFGANEFIPRNAVIRFLSKRSCTVSKFEEAVCELSMYILCGHDKDQFDRSLKPMIFGHVPAGASTKTLAHYAQIMKNHGRFQQFDYGKEGNIKMYGHDTPPAYPVEKITLPITLISGGDDWLSSVTDAKILRSKLQNVVKHYVVDEFNHLDFLFAKDAPTVVYSKILHLMNNNSHGNPEVEDNNLMLDNIDKIIQN